MIHERDYLLSRKVECSAVSGEISVVVAETVDGLRFGPAATQTRLNTRLKCPDQIQR